MTFVTEEGAYEKVQSGEWTFKQFQAWVEEMENEKFHNGYADGYSDAVETVPMFKIATSVT